ncbi:hypothetical protein BC827DRAFT_878060 [Russula dissimulans]|nr:hypothetical protein BC827DRAFT_878060 [Russula dissimulans]
MPLFRGRRPLPTSDRRNTSPPEFPTPVKPTIESHVPEGGMRSMTMPVPLPASPGTLSSTSPSIEPGPRTISAFSPTSNSLVEAWNAVKDGPSDSDLNWRLNALDDVVSTALTNAAPFQPHVVAAANAVEKTDIGKSVKNGIDKFFDSMPVFMNALDAVADLHPFLGAIVLAFKTVYTLELKRRDNDKKIITLYVEMKDMMGVLLILKDVKHDQLNASGGRGLSIKDRLGLLVERTARDIKSCSNVCDTYMKKRLLAKVIQGPSWDAKLLEFVGLFTRRRQEFEFELSIFTSQGIANANAKLDAIVDVTRALDEKMNVMIAMFLKLTSSEQKSISALVAAKGGVNALRNNDDVLLLLEETANKKSNPPGGYRTPRTKQTDPKSNVCDLRNDIFEDPEAAVEKNLTLFALKFEAQKNQIVDELTRVMERECDRVIREVKGGPHERILNSMIHEIWTEMGWRGSVKARHFVLALRDYYLEKLALESIAVRGISASVITGSQNPDAWAIRYINISRLQPILEALDDDASGFITIGEVNSFTSSRPVDWSLAHWLAFWAVGYKASIIDYAHKIEELFAKMEGVRAHVLPPNRAAIDDYFNSVWAAFHTLTAAVLSLQPGPNNPDKFNPYLEAEESRLEANLKAVDYTIDGTDTLTLITGVGRIEKTVFPLLYLLMKRHYEIMQIMRTKVLDSREIWHSVKSLPHVFNAINYRVGDLTDIFRQQKLDPEKQFQNFAHGMFKYFHNEKTLWTVDYVRNLNSPVIPYHETDEGRNIKPEDLLKYEYTNELSLDSWVYDGYSTDDVPNYRDVEPPLKDILGHWHGYRYEGQGIRQSSGTDSMMTMVLEPAEGEHRVKANAWSSRGRFTVTGSWSRYKDDVVQITLKMSFRAAYWSPISFAGRFDPGRNALTGVWRVSAGSENSNGPMEFRRIPPRYLTLYPSIKEISDSKPRSLWKFAIAAVRNDIRRDLWSWSYFSHRRDVRETVISLTMRYIFFGTPPSKEEIQKLCEAIQSLTPADACFYSSKVNRIRTYTWIHPNAWCDSCDGRIGGARLFCIDCANKSTETFDALDLCPRPECIATRITNREDLEGAHEPNHRLVKVRTVLLDRQHGRAHTAACEAYERIETFCEKIAESSRRSEEKGKPGLKDKSTFGSEATRGHLGRVLPSAKGAKDVGDNSQGQEDGIASGAIQDSQPAPQIQDSDLPTCGNCQGVLSFPFWYCVACEDNLFICNACDMDGVPDLTRCSGRHTEEHHLIRCLDPEKVEETTSATDQRLISLEERLNNMDTRFDDLSSRMENIERLLHKLVKVGESIR